MARVSPTQRGLRLLEKQGYTVAVVEKWNHHAKIRQDLYGIIDLLAIRPGEILGVQVTSTPNMAARVAKAMAEPRLKLWLEAGGRFCVLGFAKRGPRGQKKVWTSKRIEVIPEDWQ